MLALPGRGAVGRGDHVQGQELGQDAGVELVGLAGALGDDPELAGMGQDDPPGQRLDAFEQPVVAGGGLDDDLEGPEAGEEGDDAVDLDAGEAPGLEHGAVLIDDADGDRLLVEVDADGFHGSSPVKGRPRLVIHSRFTPNSESLPSARPPS